MTKEQRERVLYWARRGKAVHTGFYILKLEAEKSGLTLDPETAFFAGAGFVFALQMLINEAPGNDPTDQEMELMTKLHWELQDFDEKLQLKITPPASKRPS